MIFRRLFSLLRGKKQILQQQEPEYIYRTVSTKTAKSVSIQVKSTYETGLSFTTIKPEIGRYIAFNLNLLLQNG
jgi:hypothetical protein